MCSGTNAQHRSSNHWVGLGPSKSDSAYRFDRDAWGVKPEKYASCDNLTFSSYLCGITNIPAALRLIGSLCIRYSGVALKILPGNPFGSLSERAGLTLGHFGWPLAPVGGLGDPPWPNHGILRLQDPRLVFLRDSTTVSPKMVHKIRIVTLVSLMTFVQKWAINYSSGPP